MVEIVFAGPLGPLQAYLLHLSLVLYLDPQAAATRCQADFFCYPSRKAAVFVGLVAQSHSNHKLG